MGSCDLPAKQNNMRHTHSLLMLVVASACVEAGPVRCVLDRVVTRTSFEKGQIVEITREVECGDQERGSEEENHSSNEDDSDEDEDSSNEEDSNEDDYLDKKVESEGSSRISTTFTASTTHAAAAVGAGAGDSPQEIGPVSEHVDEYNEVHDICGNLPGESKC